MAKSSKPSPLRMGKLTTDKLASSGLDAADAVLLRIESLTPEQTQAEYPSFKTLPSLKFNYIDPRTGKPQTFAPNWPPFARYRYLKLDTSFATAAKPQRYTNAPGAGVCAYFPTNWPTWKDDIQNPKVAFIITEGELKAACACKHGYPTIGIGGVDNFRAQKQDLMLIDELDAINWVGRYVYIIYDSDFRDKPGVCNAANKLAEQLYQRGALVHFVALPDVVEGGKTGLDDFLVHEKAVDALGTLIHEHAQSFTMAKHLHALNEEIVFIEDPGFILVKETAQKLSTQAFGTRFAKRHIPERKLLANGAISLDLVPISDQWLNWGCREDLGRITYAPGESQQILNGSVSTSAWNVWPGWGCERKRDDAKAQLFLHLLQHLFQGSPADDLRWFTQWLAYPLQHPGYKLYTAAALFGIEQGTGKSMVGFIMGLIYGKNFAMIKQSELEGAFTDWCENKQFVMVDDITGTDKRHIADEIKVKITQKEVKINIKYVPSFFVPDCMNILLTSNQPDSVYLEEKDRRFFIHEVFAGPMPMKQYLEIDAAMKDGTLAPAVRDWLMRVDLTGFEPNAPAPRTAAKELMTAEVRSDLGMWVHQLKLDPEHTLSNKIQGGRAAIPGDLFTSSELLNIFKLAYPTAHANITANTVSRELHKAGFPHFNEGKTVRANNTVARYLIIRNIDKWLKAGVALGVKHIENVCHDPANNKWSS